MILIIISFSISSFSISHHSPISYHFSAFFSYFYEFFYIVLFPSSSSSHCSSTSPQQARPSASNAGISHRWYSLSLHHYPLHTRISVLVLVNTSFIIFGFIFDYLVNFNSLSLEAGCSFHYNLYIKKRTFIGLYSLCFAKLYMKLKRFWCRFCFFIDRKHFNCFHRKSQ